MNAVFAADMLYIPSGPGYWEYDSTTSFIGQLAEALGDLARLSAPSSPRGNRKLPKEFLDIRFLLTRFEPGNDLHRAMQDAFGKVFGDRMAEHPIEHDPRRRTVRPVPRLDLRDRLPRDDPGDVAAGARPPSTAPMRNSATNVCARLGQAGGDGMSKKRRMFDIDLPEEEDDAGPRTSKPRARSRRGAGRWRRRSAKTADALRRGRRSRRTSAPRTTRWRMSSCG